MRRVSIINYIEVILISIGCTLILTFLFNQLGLTDNASYREIAEHQFYGHKTLVDALMEYCFVSPLFEEAIFRYVLFNLILFVLLLVKDPKRYRNRFTIPEILMKTDTFMDFLYVESVSPSVESEDSVDGYRERKKSGDNSYSLIISHLSQLTKQAHIAVWATALLFGIYHGNLVQGVYAVIMGLVITYSYAVYRRFSVPVIAHICANAVSLLLVYL
ncbi:CPBP family intramembrane glutamic endopeptidase [Butyrivibrio proteoclasticus]|uniref:CPBP family intramembrane glutamic endopeptidase n=1 Tax=Butyrivibrio proteoclasticus TaxID=43305 RepID=UPI00047BE90C|nr:CPBP family intramembrane glutamic endopeptidase [Butyrivibrio proteoclasticus]